MKLPLRRIEWLLAALVLVLLAVRVWDPSDGGTLTKARPGCAESPSPHCLLGRARDAVAEIEDDGDRAMADCLIARAIGRAGLTEEAISFLQDPERSSSCLFIDARHHLLDGLRQADDGAAKREILDLVGQGLDERDHHSRFALALNWIEIGEIQIALALIDQGLASEKETRRACVAETMPGFIPSCGRSSQVAMELRSIAAALFIAGRRTEGLRVLDAQESEGWQILSLRDTAKQAASKPDRATGAWALSRALHLTAGLPDKDTRLLHLDDIAILARDLELAEDLETALQRSRALARSSAEPEKTVGRLRRLAVLEAKVGDPARAREALREALELAIDLPRSAQPRRLPPSPFAFLLRPRADDASQVVDPNILPRNPRREALGGIASAMGVQGLREELEDALELYADEVETLEHPLHRGKALVWLAIYTKPLNEARAKALLPEAIALIEAWPDAAEQDEVVRDIGSSIAANFGFETTEALLGPATAETFRRRRFFSLGLRAVAAGREAEALDFAGQVTKPWPRFVLTLRALKGLEAEPAGAEDEALRGRAATLLRNAVGEAEAADPKTRAETLANMAYSAAEWR